MMASLFKPTWTQAQCILFLTSLLLSCVYATPSNRTIDDTYGDPVTGHLPHYSGKWDIGQACSGCSLQPDPSETFEGTWHDSTSNTTDVRKVTLTFQGEPSATALDVQRC